jgi:hypothetical protein
MVRISLCVVLFAMSGALAPAWGQSPISDRPYDGIQAGLDAFRLAEEKRQAAVADQLYLNDTMRFYAGYPTSRGQTIYYGYLSPAAMYAYGFVAPPPAFSSLDYAYAYPAVPSWAAYPAWRGGPAVFTPWPYVPGDIYGYPMYYQPARQPIGQTQVQAGPNRWESHPVYDPPLTQYQPLPPVDSPLLDRTPYATPRELPAYELPPPPPASQGKLHTTPQAQPGSSESGSKSGAVDL